jgi:NADH-quinone oxidoreductase subunit F
VELDTLVVAIGEKPQSDSLAVMGLQVDKSGRVKTDRRTLTTNLKGVFAGGDVVSGPNTVIDAIAAGKKAAGSIDRYLRGEEIEMPGVAKLPNVYIEPVEMSEQELAQAKKAIPAVLPVAQRAKNFKEVEMSLSETQACSEASRCLRCDLAFTREKRTATELVGETHA